MTPMTQSSSFVALGDILFFIFKKKKDIYFGRGCLVAHDFFFFDKVQVI